MENTMKKSTKILLSAAFAIMLGACSDSNTTSQGYTEETQGFAYERLVGVCEKGPFLKGSEVILYELDSTTFQKTGVTYETEVSDNKGHFLFENYTVKYPVVLLEATGYYTDEVTGTKSKHKATLFALADLRKIDSVYINALSLLEYNRVMSLTENSSMKFSEAKKQASEEVQAAFDIDSASRNLEGHSMFGDSDENAYLFALNVVIQMVAKDEKVNDLLKEISEDLSEDGTLDDINLLKMFETQIDSINMDDIRENFENLDAGTVPEFEKYLCSFAGDKASEIEGCSEKAKSPSSKKEDSSSSNKEETESDSSVKSEVKDESKEETKIEPKSDSSVKDEAKNDVESSSSEEEKNICGESEFDPTYEECVEGKIQNLYKLKTYVENGEVYVKVVKKSNNHPIKDLTGCSYEADSKTVSFGSSKTTEASCAISFTSSSEDLIDVTISIAKINDESPMEGHIFAEPITLTTTSGPCKDKILEANQFCDNRDGHVYGKVTLGEQTWMTENLDYYDESNPHLKGYSTCYGNDENICKIYGRLYTWSAAMDIDYNESFEEQRPDAHGICPDGWHIPTREDFPELAEHFGKGLGFGDNNHEQDSLIYYMAEAGLEFPLAGQYYVIEEGELEFRSIGHDGYYWLSMEPIEPTDAIDISTRAPMLLVYGPDHTSSLAYKLIRTVQYKGFYHYVRCIQDSEKTE